MAYESRLNGRALLLVVAVVVAWVLNGLPFFLRRIGVIDAAVYQQEVARFCPASIQSFWLPVFCPTSPLSTLQPGRVNFISVARFYQISDAELLLKLLKYGVMVGVLLFSTQLILRHRQLRPHWRSLVPWLPLQISMVVALVIGLLKGSAIGALTGLVGILWVPLVPLVGWLLTPRRRQLLCNGLAAMILLHLPVLILESMRGLPLSRMSQVHGLPLPGRMVGLVTMPNTLGVVMVLMLAFCLGFSDRGWHHRLLVAAVLPQLLLARSGTGFFAMVLLLGMPSLERLLRDRLLYRRVGGLLLGAGGSLALLLSLPHLLGRPGMMDSLTGRGTLMLAPWHSASWPELLFGRGLGSGGVLALRLEETLASNPWLSANQSMPEVLHSTDSMWTLLLIQGGLLALGAFLGLIFFCIWRDRTARPFLGLFLLCSLTLNLTEIFPLSLLRAVVVRRSLPFEA
jgi:hypothetical protein